MDLKTFLFRFLIFVIVAAAGGLVYALAFHGMVMIGMMSPEVNGEGFGMLLTTKASYVWMGSIVVSFLSLFIRENWRLILLLSPLYAPTLFALAFTIMHHQPVAEPPPV